MKIVFMGTPWFAVESLKALVNSEHTVAAVFCQPDRPQKRGHKVMFPPVKECAIENNIPVYQPEKLRDRAVNDVLADIAPDCIVVAAYGKILPEEILNLPRFGCINVHASLLPQLRGAAPIQWSIINGDEKTGVTVMQMEKGLDTGDMLLKVETPIDINENAAELYERLSVMGGSVLIEALEKIEKGTITPIKQNDDESTYAPMLSKQLSEIDWTLSALEIHNRIRGLHPWPIASSYFNGEPIKIYASVLCHERCDAAPGEIVNEKNLTVCCGDKGLITLTEVQLLNSKRMTTKNMLCGHPVTSKFMGKKGN